MAGETLGPEKMTGGSTATGMALIKPLSFCIRETW